MCILYDTWYTVLWPQTQRCRRKLAAEVSRRSLWVQQSGGICSTLDTQCELLYKQKTGQRVYAVEKYVVVDASHSANLIGWTTAVGGKTVLYAELSLLTTLPSIFNILGSDVHFTTRFVHY